MGQAVGAGVELGIAQPFTARLHRECVGCGMGLRGDALVHPLMTLGAADRLAKCEHLLLCGGVQQLQVA
ncbi:hypothetical protein PFUM301597_00830 [Pseudomonas fluorescens]